MITILLQEEEADAVEKLLDLILTNKEASEVVFQSGAEKRNVLRASKKLYWAKCKAA